VENVTVESGPDAVDILGVRVHATSYADATARIVGWAERGESRYVCCANVHVVMEAQDSPAYAEVLRNAALVTPDGMPLVWFARGLGLVQPRVYGPDLMLHVCASAAAHRVPIGLYGSTDDTLDALQGRLHARFPELVITYRHAPPFRPARADEDESSLADCTRAGVRILFVGLGCPKQENWMAAHAGRIPAVMIGVGAAFAFHGGKVAQAPAWMQTRGLEWLYRLSREPRRLAGRYMRHNPRFVARALPALLRQRASAGSRS
jgi:N-acetylglucosaminyldiphosphoundecaprenol N-acetyl-beta-D-mannosaminyltransferase